MAARTITFGDVAENGPGMQHVGTAAGAGLTRAELEAAKLAFEAKGQVCELIDLRQDNGMGSHVSDVPIPVCDNWDAFDSACLLVVRGGGGMLSTRKHPLTAAKSSIELASELEAEQAALDPDRKAWMRGRVVNKLARWNLCFADEAQEADLENRKGTVVPFSDLPALSIVRDNLPAYLGPKTNKLNAELNVYYDPSKCGIGFHGDAERFVTIGIRLGVPIPFHYQWFHEGKPIGERIEVALGHGDLYAMGAKAVGTDWRRRKVPTLRHAAGCPKFLKIK